MAHLVPVSSADRTPPIASPSHGPTASQSRRSGAASHDRVSAGVEDVESYFSGGQRFESLEHQALNLAARLACGENRRTRHAAIPIFREWLPQIRLSSVRSVLQLLESTPGMDHVERSTLADAKVALENAERAARRRA